MKVGILGGGQLASMLAAALSRLGAQPRVYDPDPDAPALTRVADVVTAAFDDVESLGEFFASCDVVTFEREDLPVATLRAAAAAAGGTRFVPDLAVLEVAQDRVREKGFFASSGLDCVKNAVVPAGAPLDEAAVAFGFPSIAKTTRGGYDGKGQFFLESASDARAAQASFPGATWVLEEPITMLAEASCIVARTATEEQTFPVVENLHRDHILDRSLVPCRLAPPILDTIRARALAAARALDAHGLLAVEFFVAAASPDGTHRVLLNELAPRPHNSGHVFTRACTFGQFDALARILVGAPLGVPAPHPGAFCMGNLLGDVWLAQGRETDLDLSAWSDFPDVIDVHLYGKRQPALKRKMGHFVVHHADGDVALERAEQFRLALTAATPPRDTLTDR
jgi:5-(carboxyamino)imidazole ribonucleotide synthase